MRVSPITDIEEYYRYGSGRCQLQLCYQRSSIGALHLRMTLGASRSDQAWTCPLVVISARKRSGRYRPNSADRRMSVYRPWHPKAEGLNPPTRPFPTRRSGYRGNDFGLDQSVGSTNPTVHSSGINFWVLEWISYGHLQNLELSGRRLSE